MTRNFFLCFLFIAVQLYSNPNQHFLLMGSPGAGKGTLTQILSEQEPTIHLCLGDLLREEVRKETPEGLQMKDMIERGELVPKEIVFSLFEKKFKDALKGSSRIIVDGMVQSDDNVIFFDQLIMENDLEDAFTYVYLNVSEDTARKRLLNRKVCNDCKKSFSPDYSGKRCSYCNGNIIKRTDDNEAAIERRITRFFTRTIFLIERYRNRDRFIEIDAENHLDSLTALYQELFSRYGH